LSGGTAGRALRLVLRLAPWAMFTALAPANTAAPKSRVVAIRIFNFDLRP
jgi:hypothetical protein